MKPQFNNFNISIENYFQVAFEQIKEIIIDQVDKGEKINQERAFLQYMNNSELPYVTEELKQNVLSWISYLYELIFLKDVINSSEIKEIIFDTNGESLCISHKDKVSTKISTLSKRELESVLKNLANSNHVEWNFTNPFNSAQIKIQEISFRASFAHSSLFSTNAAKIFLRRNENAHIDIRTSLSIELEALFQEQITQKKNIIICGSTGSGKTTLLNHMANKTNPNEHVLVIEDTKEIHSRENWTHLLGNRYQENKGLMDLCTYALRMSPDRIILGEMRSDEVISLLMAINTGHKGLLTTIHANSCADAIQRIALLFSLYNKNGNIKSEYIQELITKNIDTIIYMKEKEVVEIIEVKGMDGLVPIYFKIYEKDCNFY